MTKQTLVGFMAWLFDAYILECLTAPIRIYLSASTNPLNIIGLLALLGVFIGSVWYHVSGKKKIRWISPGEYLIGTLSTTEGKIRHNPWPISRLALFLLIGYNLAQTARAYDPGELAFFGYTSMGSLLLGSLIQNIFLLWGSALLAMARLHGLILLALGYLFIIGSRYVNGLALAELAHPDVSKSAIWGLIANLVVGAYYFYIKTKATGSLGEK